MTRLFSVICLILLSGIPLPSSAQQTYIVNDQGAAYASCKAKAEERRLELIDTYGVPWVGPSRCTFTEQNPTAWSYQAEVSLDIHHSGSWVWASYEIYVYGIDSIDGLKNAGDCRQCGLLAGNPINVATGAKYQVESDIAVAGSGLFLNRYYNSDRIVRPATLLGTGWRMTYDRSIAVLPHDGIPTVIVYRQDGKGLYFAKSGSDWLPDSDITYTLKELHDNGAFVGWELVGDQDEKENYDAAGRLSRITARDGSYQDLTYDIDGRLESVADRDGRALVFFYNASGLLDHVIDPSGAIVSYGYDGSARLSTVGYPGGATRTYVYNENGYISASSTHPVALTGIVDESSARYASFYYDANDRAWLSTHAGDADRTELVYSGSQSVEVIDSLGRTTTRNYDVGVRSARFTGASGLSSATSNHEQTVTYDTLGFKLRGIDFSGVWTDYTHNARGLVTQRIDASNQQSSTRTTQTDWHADFHVPTERRTYDAANTLVAKSTWTYNARGQALTATQTDPVTAAIRTAATTYCEQADITNGICPLLGLVKSVNGPRTDVTDTATYTYYASDDASCASAPTTCPHRKGDLWKVTDALGRITETLAYDGAGRPLSVKDANGVITDTTYHPRGWLTARKVRGTNNAVETDDQITQIQYWPTGLVKKVTQPDGAFTAYTYDAAHRLTDISDNAGNTIHYTLDNAGNRTAEATKDSGGNLKRTLSRVYNQLGQLQAAQDAYNHATGFTYDANGNNQTVTDALSRVTDNDYDPLNRLARTLQDVGGIEAETKFEYDALDNLTKVTDPKGLDTTYQYNGFGDLTQLTSPDTGTTTYTYDSAGNRKTQTDARGIVSTYSYDALNRLTGIAYPTNSLNVGYAYDTANPVCIAGETFAIGRLTQMTDSSGDTQYCYDRFGNLTRKLQTTNAKVFTLRYAYTLAGQLQAITYPDGAIVDYVRDGQGRITEVGATPAGGVRAVLLNQATYHPFGPVASWVYGNGRTMSRPLNQNYQPTAVADNASGGLSLGYEFDAVGNLSKLYNADQSVTKAQYVYDALNRLADVKDGPTGTVIEHYGYDSTGNRTSFTNAGGTTAYTYPTTNHRLTQVGATARTYDNLGNTTQIGGTAKEFVYNDAGRMSQVKASGTATMNYQLNGKGEQVRKYVGASNTYTMYDETGRWMGDYDGTGSAIQQAIWLGDLPVGLLASNQLKYLQPDHLGTPRAVIDPAASVAIWRWDLEGEAFGSTVPNQDPDGNGAIFVLNMRFPGQRYDSASGLNYNYFRDYSPSIGRYQQSDPIGLWGGISSFTYSKNSPMRYRDTLGLGYKDLLDCIKAQFLGADVVCNPAAEAIDSVAQGVVNSPKNAREAAQDAGNFICNAGKCSAKCAIHQVLGDTATEAVINAHRQAVESALEREADTVGDVLSHYGSKAGPGASRAGGWLGRKGIPIYGQLSTLADGLFITTCSIDCSTEPLMPW